LLLISTRMMKAPLLPWLEVTKPYCCYWGGLLSWVQTLENESCWQGGLVPFFCWWWSVKGLVADGSGPRPKRKERGTVGIPSFFSVQVLGGWGA
jgi:hypothetical protein